MLATSPEPSSRTPATPSPMPGCRRRWPAAGRSFIARRTAAVAALPEFEALRDTARDIKNHTLANLDFYLETWEANVAAAGGKVHWCATADEARDAVLDDLPARPARAPSPRASR